MTFTNFFPIWKTWGATDELMFNLCWRDLNICLLDGSISSLNLCWAPVSCWCSTMIRGILVLLLWAILTLLFSMLTLLVYAHWGSLKQPTPVFLFQGCSRIQITLDLGRSVRTESHFFLNSAQYLFFFLCAVFQWGVGNDELFCIHLLKGGLFLPQETATSLPSSPWDEHLSAAATLWLHLVIAVKIKQTRNHKVLLKNTINSLDTQALIIKTMPHKHAWRPIWLRQFLSQWRLSSQMTLACSCWQLQLYRTIVSPTCHILKLRSTQ